MLTKDVLLKPREVELGHRKPSTIQKPSSGCFLTHRLLGNHPGPLEGTVLELLSQQTTEGPNSTQLVRQPA